MADHEPSAGRVRFESATAILPVQDLEASVEHYVGVLGFRLDWQQPGVIASLSRDRCALFLCEGDQGHAGTWVWIGVDDAPALHEEYRRRGARIRHPPTHYTWACEMQVEDLDGNVLRLGSKPQVDQPLGEWLDARGRRWTRSPAGGWTRVPGGGDGAAFVGSWSVLEARLPDGEPGYTGSITIDRLDDVFDLTWDISAGRYCGIGLPSHGHLFVACGEQSAGLGLAVYEREPSGDVSVRWCTPELEGAVGGGRLASRFAGGVEGAHEVTHVLPDGTPHGAWTLSLRRAGSLFEATWRKGDRVHRTGLAFETQSGVAAAWYPDPAQLALLDYSVDAARPDRLTAAWALGGFTSLGTEALERRTGP